MANAWRGMLGALFVAVALALSITSAAPQGRAPSSFPPEFRAPNASEESRFAVLDSRARAGGAPASVEQAYRDMFVILYATYGPNHPVTATYLFNYALWLYEQRDFARSEQAFRRTLAIQQASLGRNDQRTLETAISWANTLHGQQRAAEAVAIYAEYIPLLRENNDLNRLFMFLYAEALTDLGRAEDARAILERRLQWTEAGAPRTPELADALSEYGHVLAFNLHRPAEAIPFYQRALVIREARLPAEGDEWVSLAEDYLNVLATGASGARDRPLAQRVLAYRQAHGGINSADYARALDRMAYMMVNDGESATAAEAARRILTIQSADASTRSRATLLLGKISVGEGRLSEGEAHYRRALEIADAPGREAGFARESALYELAALMETQGRHDEQEALLRRVLALREADPLARDSMPVAEVLMRLAMAQVSLGRADEGEMLMRRSLAIYERQAGPNARSTLTAVTGLAILLIRRQRPGAVEMAQRAVAGTVALEGENSSNAGTAKLTLGLELERLGRSAEAGAMYRQSAAALEASDPNSVVANYARLSAAFFELRSGRPSEALVLSRRALQVQALLASRAGAATPEDSLLNGLAIGRRAAGATVVHAAWGVAAQSPQQAAALRAEAFEAAQTAHASGAGDALAMGGARVAADQAGLASVIGAWRAALDRLAAIDAAIAAAARQNDDAARRTLASERAEVDRERAAREAELRQRFPRFFDLIESSALPAAAVQATLRADEALIVLTPPPGAESRPYIFALTQTGFAWMQAPITYGDLRSEIAALHGMLATGGATRAPSGASAQAQVRGFDRARAHRLYQALFGAPEIAALIGDKPSWTLAPQADLISLPFSALVTETPQGESSDPAALRATRWLGAERALAVTPSISSLRAQRGATQTRAGARLPFFGLGDPTFSGAATQTASLETSRFYSRNAVNVEEVRRLPRLARTSAEIEALARSFGAGRESYVLGAQATEAELLARDRDGRLGRAEVIAFATHGLVAGDLNNALAEPALALTPPPSGPGAIDPRNDGLLTASEAARLRLSARWVILSACNTAAGGQPNAEGLTGLARAFFYAGARTLLVSHWPVGDVAAERLTTRAVALQQQSNLTTAEALRRSMRDLMADTSADASGRSFAHPSAWAPFALVSAE